MIDIKKIKDEELLKASGGARVFIPDCANFSLSPSRDMSSKIEKDNMDWTYDCKDCIHWQGPEGPCKLGNKFTV